MQIHPEHIHVVDVMAPAADAAGRSSDVVTLKNAKAAWIEVSINQANAATVAVTVQQCTAVDGTGAKAIATAVPIYVNQDLATSDVHARQADGVSFTTSAATTRKFIRFVIDPATLDLANNFDCIRVVTGASNAANITSARILLFSQYPQDPPITARAN